MPVLPANAPKRLAVVGAGPAGLAFAVNAAARGHHVTLFDALPEIGGQFNIAKQIPGKEEFHETLRYYRTMLDLHGVESTPEHPRHDRRICWRSMRRSSPPVSPRACRRSTGSIHPKVLSYLDVLRDKAPVGAKVAIIGCGGIGFDTAMFLSRVGRGHQPGYRRVLPRMGYRYQPANGGRAEC